MKRVALMLTVPFFFSCLSNPTSSNSTNTTQNNPPPVACYQPDVLDYPSNNPFVGKWIALDTFYLYWTAATYSFQISNETNRPETLTFGSDFKWFSNASGYGDADHKWTYMGGCYFFQDSSPNLAFFFPYTGYHDLLTTYSISNDTLFLQINKLDAGYAPLNVNINRETKYKKIN